MKKEVKMGARKKIILVVVSVVLVVSVISSVALLSVNSLLYPEIYIENLDQSGTYDYLDEAITNVTGLGAGGEESGIKLSFITLPEGGVEALVNDNLPDVLAYLRGDIEDFSVLISVDGSGLRDFLETQMESFPVCSMGESSKDSNGNSVCRPPEESVSAFLDEQLAEHGIEIPDKGYIDFAEIYDLNGGDAENLKSYVGTYKTFLYTSLIVFFILAVLIVLIPRDEGQGLKIFGIDLMISGVLLSVLYFIGRSVISSPGLEPKAISDFIIGLGNSLLSKEILYGLIVLGFGVMVFTISFFVGKNSKSSIV